MELTKRTVEKLYAAPIDVTLYNGNFNKASVKVKNNKVEYELVVEDTHPLLRSLSICKEPKTTFIVWGSPYMGVNEKIPDCLKDLESKLLSATKMTDEYAAQLYTNMVSALNEFYEDMGWLK